MHFDLILRGGEIATPERTERADVGIAGGKIAAIGHLDASAAAEVVEIGGLTVLPGIIDTQVHFREPGMEHKEDIESGTRAAVAGGVTTVLEMPNTLPPTTTADALADKVRRASGRAWCNIGFFLGAALDNLDELAELERLPGTPGIKLFMGSSTGTLLVPDDDHVLRVLQNGRKRVPVHSEDSFRLESRKSLFESPTVFDHPNLRDAECARLCTERLLRLARAAGRPVHVLHVSTADELPMLASAKASGQDVTAEITPQHLWFAAPEAYERLGTLAQMNPPVRTAEHREALRAAVRNGLFDVIGSDHAPHTLEEKAEPYPKSPSGMPGVQTLFPAMLALIEDFDLMPLGMLIRMAVESPARLYGIQGKGRLAIGYDADLAVYDLRQRYRFDRSMAHAKCGWSPFEGEMLRGKPVHTIVGGAFAFRDGAHGDAPPGSIPVFAEER